jgi:hypothetical protein
VSKLAEEKKDEKNNASSETQDEGKDSKGQDAQEFVQIPKSEYEGWKKEMEETREFREKTTDYIKGASVVVTTLASDPELTKAFRSKLVGDGQVSGEQQEQDGEKKETAPGESGKAQVPFEVTEVAKSQRLEITNSFEKEVGIANMKPEERKQARQAIETYLNGFGVSWQTSPLSGLRETLNKAWVGTNAEKLKEEGKLEGFAQMRTNMDGTMPTISGTAPNTSSHEAGLTEGQKKWAEKLGVDPEKAKKTYLERDGEEKRVPPAEKKE